MRLFLRQSLVLGEGSNTLVLSSFVIVPSAKDGTIFTIITPRSTDNELINCGSHPLPNPDLGIFGRILPTLQDRAFFTIWLMYP